MHCTLRGGLEHNNLRCPGCKSQLSFERDKLGVEHLVYREDPLQKTYQGGLLSKGCNKIVHVYPSNNILRCPVRLVKKYVSLLPESKRCSKLYLRCRKNAMPSTWFCDQPYGVNKIKNTVKEICKLAGIDRKFTNHSLRATCASRMYDSMCLNKLLKKSWGTNLNVFEFTIEPARYYRSQPVRLFLVN